MKRTAVFAHYDKNNLIQDYVVYYLSELKKYAEKIIFVSDSDVLPEELKKIEGIVEQSIIGRHGEYDFGSYKRGFLYAKENNLLTACEELILANDSCYARSRKCFLLCQKNLLISGVLLLLTRE